MKGKFSNQVSVRQIDALHVNVKDLLVASIPKKKKKDVISIFFSLSILN